MKNIVSWSGGKDSTATIILAHEHDISIDEIVMVTLWFDKSRNIPAILPEHWEFITKVAKPKFEEWGYKVTFVDGKDDYYTLFHNRIGEKAKPEYIGKKRGFLIGGMCSMTNCKQKTIKGIQKKYADWCSLQGIAIDEPERLERMHNRPNTRSLLEEYNMTEAEARALCERYGLLSPIYRWGQRDGCWFCPNKRISHFANLKQNHPELWRELELFAQEEDLCTWSFKYGLTVAQVSEKVDKYLKQPKQITIEEILKEYER